MASTDFRKLITAPAPGLEGEGPLSSRLNYKEECERFGIDPRLGQLDPLAYALEVVSRIGPIQDEDGTLK